MISVGGIESAIDSVADVVGSCMGAVLVMQAP